MRVAAGWATLSTLLLSGCHSAFMTATIRNETSAPIRLVELDYPSASFGTQALTSGQDLKYRFKILGSGATRLIWTDAHNVEQHAEGPSLSEGMEGALTVSVTPGGVRWSTKLASK